MPVRAACPNPDCRRSYNLADGLATPTARCPACRAVLTYPDAPAPAPDTVVTSAPNRDRARPAPRPADPPAARGYEVQGEIARGGMGVVYRARELTLKREVAIKVLRPGLASHREALRRFVAEARVTAALEHPGIPPVHALGRLADRRPFLAMKLVRGRTLADLLDERKSPADDVLRFVGVFEKVCEAVAFAHSRGVVHRDLKPSNIMVGDFGEVQVMDWGLAKLLGEPESVRPPEPGASPPEVPATAEQPAGGPASPGPPAADRTRSGTILGTPAYMSPEQARGDWAAVGPRSDVFALGAVLCTILTGEPPYSGGPALHLVARAAVADQRDAIDRLDRCGAPSELIAIVLECLRRDPGARPADASAVVRLLTAYRAGQEQRLRRAEAERAQNLARSEIRRREHAESKVREAVEAHEWEQRRRLLFQIAFVAATVVAALLLGACVSLLAVSK